MSKVCSSCGEVVSDDCAFCPKCGNQSFNVDNNSQNGNTAANFNLGQASEEKDNGVGFDTVEKESPIDSGDVQATQNNGQVVSTPQAQAVAQPQNQTTNQPPFVSTPPAGVIDNNFFNNLDDANKKVNKPKKKSTKIDSKIIWTVCGIIGIVLLVISITLFILLALADGAEEPAPYDPKSYFTEENSKVIGNDDFGYIKVPNTWEDISSTAGNGSLLFTDSSTNSKWYLLLSYVNDGVTTPDLFASSTYNALVGEGALEVSVNQEVVNSFTTYKVVGFKPGLQRYTASWYFATEDGKTRYIAIEGPDRVNEFYNMIYTYKLKK